MKDSSRIHKTLSYVELVEKAKKLKALSERGIGGEKDSAYIHYLNFIKKHNIDDSEIDDGRYKRSFFIENDYYETILSYIILSVNPFSFINKDGGYYYVELDDEDFVEVNYKMSIFYDSFEKNIRYAKDLFSFKFNEKKDYLVFMTAFISKNNKSFEPDEYAWKKTRGNMGKKVNPDMEKQNKDMSGDNDLKAESSENTKDDVQEQNKENSGEPLTQFDIHRYSEYLKIIDPVIYVRANKTIKNEKINFKWITKN